MCYGLNCYTPKYISYTYTHSSETDATWDYGLKAVPSAPLVALGSAVVYYREHGLYKL